MNTVAAPHAGPKGRLIGQLYVQVLLGIAAGVTVGIVWPAFGAQLEWIAKLFVSLVKMIIAPVIFLTIVTGIGALTQVSEVGRVAGRAMAYFFAVSSLALVIGLIVANIVQPGAGMNVDPSTLDASAVAGYATQAEKSTITGFILDIVPTTVLSALTDGSVLQVLLVAVLFGVALAMVGEVGKPVLAFAESLSIVVFKLVAIVMRIAPLGAFAAMAFTIGRYGVGTLLNLGQLVATFYLTSAFFVVVILGLIARAAGFSLFGLLRYLREELLLVLGTSSSEPALPGLMNKMERAGVAKPVVGIVVPTGYSFNLDGTNIYMTLAALFIAQATGVELSWGQQFALLGVAMISSKGAAGVTGAGFITLAATLSIMPSVPVAGIALILGVDRFMSECRAITNFIGNAVATIVIARWEGDLDNDRLQAVLKNPKTTIDDDWPSERELTQSAPID
ncbi:C4-dicarboxylate transporter DctA [Sphingomonas glaciei]|uniref:C4-dicarboxylate transporter DctA n=1 Tax=Sphingomonas glaciei TaxID=2938948 RepID=A0ABY5MYY7_9SPHN|nr:C4-dicarboxylate transporter DctA [Sphingomonas glaciei]UUR08298.1 C4-dicarboxylate transporter DctA [Sphingomonas glaciei]